VAAAPFRFYAAETGCEALFAHRPRHRVAKRRFALVLAGC
jgi:hypothetical protein